jgi:putative DNA primase/helicase
MPNNEDREYLRKILGYQLTGNMDARVFFIWYGDGSNGKSVIMKLLKNILGPMYHQCGKGIFMKTSEGCAESASPDKVALIGSRIATYSEGETSDDVDINESFLKMVSGKDEINARPLFNEPLTFFPLCKLNFLTNFRPKIQVEIKQ